MATEKEGYVVTQPTALYSLPSRSSENKMFNEDLLRGLGLTDLIPRKIIQLQPGEILGKGSGPSSSRLLYDRENEFYKVEYTTNYFPLPKISGYVLRSDVRPVNPDHVMDTAANLCTIKCSAHKMGAVCQSGLFKDTIAEVEKYQSEIKNEEDLESYFFSFRKDCENELFQKYKNEYKQYISEAASAFEIPEHLLACLLFKENQWDQTTSSANAIGVAQLMPHTIRYSSNIIERINTSEKELARYEKIVERYQRQAAEFLKNPNSKNRIPAQLRKDYEYAKSILYNKSLSKKWTTYIDNLRKTPAFKENYRTAPWRGRYPTTFNSERARIPPLAIGVSAMYLRDIIEGFKDNFEEETFKSPGQLVDFLVAVSGAYNMGPVRAQRLIGSPAPSRAADWVKRLESNAETTKHMRSIKRCMIKGNEPPLMISRSGKLVNQNPCSGRTQ